MNRSDDIDENKQQQWQSRVARGRLDLSASVEEALVDVAAHEDNDASEFEDDELVLESTVLIPPRLSLQSKQLPAVHASTKVQTNHFSKAKTGIADSSDLEPFNPATSKLRSPRRTTKVRLQVVPNPESGERAGTPFEATTNPTLSVIEKLEGPRESLAFDTKKAIAGSDQFEKGQSERMVANTDITASSVVIVVLTADPGPVVVQYVTLHPKVGFTVHLSANTKKATPFNYRIC